MIRFKRTKSLCKECPLRGNKKVFSLCEVDKPKIALMGEAPGAHEEEEGKPFVGPAGKWLKSAIGKTGLLFHTTYRLNSICCRPPRNDIGSFEAIEALRCCKPGLEEELSYMKKLGIKIIVPLGNTPCDSLNLGGKISKIRGSVYYQNETVILPTYHPSFIMRGMLKEEGTWVADLVKARDLSLKKYIPPKENFNLFPTLSDLKKFHSFCLKNKPLLGVDIETTSLSPYHSRIVVVGLSWSGEDAISIPFLKKGGERYWNGDTPEVESLLKDILLKCPTLFQNGLFDVRHLEEKGFRVGNVKHDVLLMHAAVHPELPHNLGYITSIYGTTPYWKEEFQVRDGSILEMEDETLRRYNLRDAVVLHQILPELQKDLKETGTVHIYENISLPLIAPILQMEKNGIGFSERKQDSWKRELEKRSKEEEKKLRKLGGFPSSFNLSSSDHMRAFLYGTLPTSYTKALEELAKYEANPKLRKDTKKYASFVEIRDTFSKVKPLVRLPRVIKTEGGDAATDKEAMLSIQRMLVNRLNAVENLKRPTMEHKAEKVNLKRLIEFIAVFREFKATEKLLSTYVNFNVGPDGRVHGEYMIHGTRTGRLCVDPDTTFIEAPRDLKRFPKGILMKNIRVGDWVYSFDHKRELCLRKVKWIGPTKFCDTVVVSYKEFGSSKITTMITSPDHLFRLYRGEWKHAELLKKGDRLLFMVNRGFDGGYSSFYPHSRNRANGKKGGGYSLEHRFIYSSVNNMVFPLGKAIINHRDGNRLNNSPSNLEWCQSITDHLHKHAYTVKDYEKALKTGVGKRGKKLKDITLAKYKNRIEKLKLQGRNHRVVSVKPGPKMQLWDMEVEGTHCFIGNGVALHNSSRNPNMQNITKDVKKLFFAEEGNIFIQGDYSNLELRVLAYVSEDDVLMDIFNQGLNVHTENCKLLFNITEDHPQWKACRKASKIYIFGRNYGGSLNGVYQQVLKEVPEMPLTLAQFTAVDKKYRDGHPKYAEWYDATVKEVRKSRVLTTPFGRKRIFLGTEDEITREGLNTQIQSPAADIANISLIALEKESRSGLFKMCGTVHDSILVETKKSNLKKVVKIMKKCMEHEVTIGKHKVSFPVDFEYGECWGDLKTYES